MVSSEATALTITFGLSILCRIDRYCIGDVTRFPAVTHSADLRAEFRIGGGDDRIRRVNTEATEVLRAWRRSCTVQWVLAEAADDVFFF